MAETSGKSRPGRCLRQWLGMAVLAVLLSSCAGRGARPAESSRNLERVEAMADQAYREGRYSEASDHYLFLVRALPDSEDFWYRLANSHARAGNERQAALAYEQSVALNPGNPKAWHNLGIMLHRQSMNALARSAARAKETDDPVGQESLRVLRALRQASETIGGRKRVDQGPLGSTHVVGEEAQEAGTDEDAE